MRAIREEPLQAGPRQVARLLAAIVASAVLLAASSRRVVAGELCEGCSQLGSLSVVFSSLQPEEPRVGDLVTFTYTYTAFLPGPVTCGGARCRFSGGETILGGDDPPVRFAANQIVVQRVAVAAGTASVELAVRAETEERCLFLDEFGCQSYFQPVFIDVSSDPREILVVDVSTATPTATPTATDSPTVPFTASATPTPTPPVINTQGPTLTESPTATETPPAVPSDTPTATPSDTPQPVGEGDDDGCAIAAAPPRPGVVLLLAAVPILLRVRGRVRRRHWT